MTRTLARFPLGWREHPSPYLLDPAPDRPVPAAARLNYCE